MTDSLSLCIDDLVVAFDRKPVLNAVSLTVRPGESLALVGPNGAGKSTLLRAVLGIVPITQGDVSVLGLSPVAARRHVAYVPQAETLDPEFPVTAAQVVLMGRYREIGWWRRPVGRRQTCRSRRARRGWIERPGHKPLRHVIGRPASASAPRSGHCPEGPVAVT